MQAVEAGAQATHALRRRSQSRRVSRGHAWPVTELARTPAQLVGNQPVNVRSRALH